MGKMKSEAMGDSAPSRAPYFDIGRFRLSSVLLPDRVWIRDMEEGEAGSFDTKKLEAVLLKFFSEEF